MTALVAILRDHGDAVEADLLRFYGVDLADLYRGGLSLRRLSVLLKHLPIDAALPRVLGDMPPGWDTHAYLLADLFHAFTGEPHPSRPTAKTKGDRYRDSRKRLEEQRARLAARRARVNGAEG